MHQISLFKLTKFSAFIDNTANITKNGAWNAPYAKIIEFNIYLKLHII